MRIHGSLLAMGELILTLTEAEISANPAIYNVKSLNSILIEGNPALPSKVA
jgi:hypothetical protein